MRFDTADAKRRTQLTQDLLFGHWGELTDAKIVKVEVFAVLTTTGAPTETKLDLSNRNWTETDVKMLHEAMEASTNNRPSPLQWLLASACKRAPTLPPERAHASRGTENHGDIEIFETVHGGFGHQVPLRYAEVACRLQQCVDAQTRADQQRTVFPS